MNIEVFREYCLSKKGVTEDFPFDSVTLVFKVMGKIFALTDVNNFESINLKCDPEKAIELREQYPGVRPGYHMNKKHWNTINNEPPIAHNILFSWIDHSYELVSSGLTKAQKQVLQTL
ncbi:MAG: MmcQ/YjbR family DNA-binding protein [Bacteroidetes bacterium]|nr:MmcQ/YjbR family DNA-binding protein [Bacteroidota bacterium]HET6245633.1 MmcQ/YjbR family DNA-binding protein [Bacteroidia bacterium]